MAAKSALDILKKILLSFKTNWGLKLVSLFFAVILWNYVIAEANPSRMMPFNGIPMKPPNMAQLQSMGLTIKGDVSSYLKDVNVVIDLSRSEALLLKKSDIQADVDLSGITKEGKQNVKVQVKSLRGNVVRFSPDTISVTVEKLGKRVVPVICELLDSLPDGYWRGDPAVLPSELEITGLEITGAVSDVEKVYKAIVQISLSGLTQDLSTACDFVLLDKNGNAVSSAGLNLSKPNCIVNLQVQPKKIVPINVDKALNGAVARGYERTGIDAPTEIEIAGPKEVLNTISELSPGKIDLSGAKSDISVTKIMEMPKGVHAIGSNSITVLIKIGMKQATVTENDIRIIIVGLGSGLKVDQSFTANVTLTCPELYVSDIRRSLIHLTADATGLQAGTYTLPIHAVYSDPEAGVSDIVTDPLEIPVKIVSSTAP